MMTGLVQAEDEMLLRSLADLVPDDMVNAELSDLDGFCLDSAVLHASNPGLQHAATTFQAGAQFITQKSNFSAWLHSTCID
jgi:hypothetical protein